MFLTNKQLLFKVAKHIHINCRPCSLHLSRYCMVHLELLKSHPSYKRSVLLEYANGFLSNVHAQHKSHQACVVFTIGVSRLLLHRLIVVKESGSTVDKVFKNYF